MTDFWELFDPLPKQIAFLQEAKRHRYVLFGGARGGGKSKLLRWGLLWQLLEWARQGHKNVRVGLFSEDYPTLKDRQVGKIKVEFPAFLGTIKATQDEGLGFYLTEQYGGGAILLRNLDEPAKYQSAEFAAVAVEELTKNPIEVFDILRGSLRWPGIPRTAFWGATNPGGPGHLWVKALWVDRDFSGEYKRLAELQEEFAFIRSLPADNPYLSQEYWQELNSLPEPLRKAWVEGSWESFEGQAFGEWDTDIHVTKFCPENSSDEWEWSFGGDWGRTRGWLGLFASGPKDFHICRHEWTFSDLDAYTAGYQWARQIQRFPRSHWGVLDAPPMPDVALSIIERFQQGMKDALGSLTPAVVATPRGQKNYRHTKKQELHRSLAFTKHEDGTVLRRPRLTFHDSCKYLIRTIPALPIADNDSEDIDTDADDHGYDGVTGWLMSRPPVLPGDDMTPEPGTDRHPGYNKDGSKKSRWRDKLEPEEVGTGRFTRYHGQSGGWD